MIEIEVDVHPSVTLAADVAEANGAPPFHPVATIVLDFGGDNAVDAPILIRRGQFDVGVLEDVAELGRLGHRVFLAFETMEDREVFNSIMSKAQTGRQQT